jgi:membrane protease YdiL (CAAX protease family)
MLQAVAIGVAIVLAGTIPRNIVFAANLRYLTGFPWAVPVMAAYMFVFWRYLEGAGPPESTAAERRAGLGAPIAGIVEEAAFRGYMQRPIERTHGIWLAILITGTMFALVHLDFTPVLWPYYVAVAAIYGTVSYFTDSILPAVVLHTSGNVYSNLDLWLHGQAEWQAPAGEKLLVWTTGPDRAFWLEGAAFVILTALMLIAYRTLARAARHDSPRPPLETGVN